MGEFTVTEMIVGDALETLRTMDAGSVRCCMTSPPYWGLRDYGTAEWKGGEAACEHQPRRGIQGADGDRAGRTFTGSKPQGATCSRCGARRIDQQLGLEETPEQYVENLADVFREVRRVLTDDGTLWLNLGDSYANPGHYKGNPGDHGTIGRPRQADRELVDGHQYRKEFGALKNKDLCGIPWRVAFALQADGWWLRSDIIWHKPNPMPESVKDRPTKAHEYLFLLSKSERYYYDADAIAEPLSTDPRENYPSRARVTGRGEQGTADARGNDRDKSGGFPPRKSGNKRRKYGDDVDRPGSHIGRSIPWEGYTRNRRSVWTITTKPFPEAHFAVFPLTLPMLCIQAGSERGDIVLDPFAGAGTTGVAATKLGRSFVGIELNPEYAEMARRRIKGTPLALDLE
ncbi:MAG: DNA methyltransferase [Gemmatimonadota bacterium]